MGKTFYNEENRKFCELHIWCLCAKVKTKAGGQVERYVDPKAMPNLNYIPN